MYKLLDLSLSPWEHRWEVLKEALIKNNIQLQVDFAVKAEMESPDFLKTNYAKAVKEHYDILILDEKQSEDVMGFLQYKTQESIHLGAANIFIRKEEKLWPSLLFEEALVSAINKSFLHLDLNSTALIAGLGAYAKFVVAALSKVGFKNIALTDINADKINIFVKDIQKKFFNINFVPFEHSQINTLPGECSLLVNTSPLSLDNKILDELYFFNFLKAQGCVVDLTLIPPFTPLLSEAQSWGARLLSGDKVACFTDLIMVEKLFQVKLDESEYCHALIEQAAKIKVDVQSYLKRFMDRS